MTHRRLIMSERITAIAGASILLALVLASYYYAVQTGLMGLRYVPSPESPDFTAENVTLTDFSPEGGPTTRLVAAHVAHFSDERMRAENALFVTLDPAKLQTTLRADEAWSNDGMETVELEGNVEYTRAAGPAEPDLYFRTDRLRGWLDTYRFDTTAPVFMRRGNDVTEAEEGMVYDNITRTVELRKRVHTVLQPQNFHSSTLER